MNVSHLLIVVPCLVAAHSMAPDQLDGTLGAGGIQAVVVRHHLLALGVGKHL